jgi:hypothetical protein
MPVSYTEYAQEVMAKAVDRSLQGSHEAIVSLIEKNKDRKIIIPEFVK